MKFTPFAKPFLALAAFCCFCFAVPTLAQDKDWRPISPAEMSATSSTVEPNADAEALFWEVRVDDSDRGEVSLNHYVRVKIFTEKGRDDYSKHDILFLKGTKVKEIEARVTKHDGSITYLNKNDVMEREIVKANGFKVRAKSFALPGLEIGSIVEYKYREVIDNGSAAMRMMFQRDIPIRTISYYVRPFRGRLTLFSVPFNMKGIKFEKDEKSFYRATMNNVPAFHDEPYSLPEDEIKSWMYIYYSAQRTTDPTQYWTGQSKFFYEISKTYFKPTGDIQKTADQITAGAKDDEEKLRRIFDFVKHEITNLAYTDKPSESDIKKVQKAESPADILKLKMGAPRQIDQLFGTLAKAAGFDVRVALGADRSDVLLNPNVSNMDLMVGSSLIAVRSGNGWRFFGPSSYFTPYGSVRWVSEGEPALISDPNDLIWEKVPLTSAENSTIKRVGKFKMLADGSLEGEGRFEYSGHEAYYRKIITLGDTAAEREKALTDLLKQSISSNIELVSYSIENDSDPEKSFIYKFKVRIPNFAVRTGKRFFFVLNVFESLSKPVFTAEKRRYDIYISYPWTETEEMEIEVPEGFSLESVDAPASVSDPKGILKYVPDLKTSTDKKILYYSRSLSFGNGGHIRFSSQVYPALKNLFELVNKNDLHQLTLRQDDKATAAAQ